MRRWIAAVACSALLVPGQAEAADTTKVKAKPAPLPAPYAGVYQPQGVDEVGLWREDDEHERSLANSPLLIRDEALTAYVKRVLCRAIGTDRCNAVRV